jgi:hypothetical protein
MKTKLYYNLDTPQAHHFAGLKKGDKMVLVGSRIPIARL